MSTVSTARLFRASCLALVVTSMSFALRGEAGATWAAEFHLTQEQVGWINGAAFWGFLLSMVVGGPLCDSFGLGRVVWLAFVGHLAGILLTIFAWDFWSLFTGTIVFGVANGAVEAACNPMIATLFPDNKTTRLNQFHVWFPGGIVIGGLLAFALGRLGFGWKIQFALMLLPLAGYALMFRGQSFPQTERVQQGVSSSAMFLACLKPGFLLMVACMLFTAASELGPSQWIPNILSHAGVSGILVLVWITGLMAVGRQFAGVFVHRLSPPGMLLACAVLTTLGLFALSRATGGLLFAAATVFAFGVCYFWPTMLGVVSERFPQTGALGLAVMGGAGVFSTSLILPVIGRFYDAGIAARLPAGLTVDQVAAASLGAIQAEAGREALGYVAVLPVALVVVFLLMFLLQRRAPAAAS